jgi:hypothetical protein
MLREIFVRRRLSLLDLAADLAVPPLGLLGVAAFSGAVLVSVLSGAGLMSPWLTLPWLTGLVTVAGFALVGLRSAKAPGWMYRRLLSTPAFLVRKVLGTAGVVKSRSSDSWIRTERPSEVGP